MRTYYGAYPNLERQFIRHLSGLSASAQAKPVLVLCPSGRLSEYLRNRAARANGMISNVFFVTFGQLIDTLDKEDGTAQKPLLPADSFHDYLLKNLLLLPELKRYPISRGFISAVKTSLRDMADALVDETLLQEHVITSTDPALAADQAHGQWLAEVYRRYQQQLDHVDGYRSYRQYFSRALAQAEKSAWLAQFAEIVVYGFYELTGRQLELFQTLQTYYPLTVFWAYAPHEAFAFGRPFFETNIAGRSAESIALTEPPDTAAGALSECLFTADSTQMPPTLRAVSAPNVEGELFFVAKEILRLQEEGLNGADIAVMARSLEPYKTRLPHVFAQNEIAVQAHFSFALTTHPLGVFLTNLLGLLRGGFEREDVLAVMDSPYFKPHNTWRYLIAGCLAKRDYSQWTQLVNPSVKNYDPAFLTCLEQIKTELEFLEKPLSWSTLCQAAQTFLQTYTDTTLFSPQENTLWQQVQTLLAGLQRFESACKQARGGEFLDEFLAALHAAQYARVYDEPNGVCVGDVQSLRGMRFKAVFLLGMNEKVFPQVIVEDPVLKDYYRRVMRDQLGFWINQKMERFDEEKLLFTGALQAGQQAVYVSYLRSDEAGKPLVLSSYMAELARAAGSDVEHLPLQRVSAHLLERLADCPVRYLTEKEISLALSAQQAGEVVYEKAGLLSAQTHDILTAARAISSDGALNEYDGLIASGAAIFKSENTKGFSPSALQDLAHCPMKYFLAKGVGLREPDEALSRSELAPNLRGTAYHEILMTYYAQLYQEGLTGQLFDSALQARMEQTVQQHCPPDGYKRFGIYPVIWEMIVQDMQQKLTDFAVQDAQQLGDYVPQIFETYFEQIYHPAEQVSLKLKGIIDRIDIDEKQHTFRILDYKSGRPGSKNLADVLFKQVILQPFIYLLLAQGQAQTESLQPDGAALLSIQKGYFRQELSQASFEMLRQRAGVFFMLLMQLMQRGQFFIHPGTHCTYCPYAAICRKEAFHSLLRARHAPAAQALEEATQ